MEHHSNIVPWQLVCEQTGATLRVVPITDAGELDMAAYEAALGERTRFVSAIHVSNALGTVNPVERMVELAHARGRPGAARRRAGARAPARGRAGARLRVLRVLRPQDVRADRHRRALRQGVGPRAMPPYQGGGDMIASVTFEKTTYNTLPYKFEAGTPNIAGRRGLRGRRGLPRPVRHARGRGPRGRAARATRRRASGRWTALRVIGQAAQEGGRAIVRDWKASTRTMSARSSTARASPCAPGSTVRSR